MPRGDRRSARITARGRKKLTKRPVARTRCAYSETPDMMRARAKIQVIGDECVDPRHQKKKSERTQRKIKSPVPATLIEVLVSRQTMNKRGIE